MKGIFVYVLENMLTLVSLGKMHNSGNLNAQKFKIWGQAILKVIQVKLV